MADVNDYPLCDKCHKPVPPENDATIFEALYRGMPIIVLASEPRHLLPTEDCEGSPSRAQYLEGQPRDPRGEYDFYPECVQGMRETYQMLQDYAKFAKGE